MSVADIDFTKNDESTLHLMAFDALGNLVAETYRILKPSTTLEAENRSAILLAIASDVPFKSIRIESNYVQYHMIDNLVFHAQ